jgi:hypothetical protein
MSQQSVKKSLNAIPVNLNRFVSFANGFRKRQNSRFEFRSYFVSPAFLRKARSLILKSFSVTSGVFPTPLQSWSSGLVMVENSTNPNQENS